VGVEVAGCGAMVNCELDDLSLKFELDFHSSFELPVEFEIDFHLRFLPQADQQHSHGNLRRSFFSLPPTPGYHKSSQTLPHSDPILISNLFAIKFHSFSFAKAQFPISFKECFMATTKRLWLNLWCGIVHDASMERKQSRA
jgi:hypothetical protein